MGFHADISGYVETYYQLHLQAPANHVTALRAFDTRDRAFALSNAALGATGERGPLVARVILQIAATPSIQQASFAYTARSGLVVDGGLVPSPIGPEVIPIKDNWNWSRSDLFFALPAYHTGVRAGYPLGGGWTGMVHVYNGWSPDEDTNAEPIIAVSAAYAGDRVTGQVLYFGGVERSAWRHLLDAYATVIATDDVTVMVHADGGVERDRAGTAGWLAAAVYAKVALTPRLYAAARADYFRQWTAILWPTAWIASGTATLAYQPADGLSVRLEYRHDHAASPVFFTRDVMSDMQDTVTVGATAWF